MYSDGTPYSFGLVELRSNPIYTTTDAGGYFRFDDVPVGLHTISAVQNNSVLASVKVEIRKTSRQEDIGIAKLDVGSFVVQVSLDVIQINISLRIEGDELDLFEAVVSMREGDPEPTAPVAPSLPDIGPEPGLPSDPDLPVTPDPNAQPGPDTPSGPDVPPEPPVPPGPDVPPEEEEGDDDPDIIASDGYGAGSRWTVGTSVDVFSPRPGNSGVVTINGETVIAPGASGQYAFKIENPGRRAVRYVIRLNESDQNDPKLPLRYRLATGLPGAGYVGGSSWQEVGAISMGEVTIGPGETHYYTLEWKWETGDDAVDTSIGLQEPGPVYVLNIVINAWYR